MSAKDPGVITLDELGTPPPLELRRLPRVVGAGFQMAWGAAPRELSLTMALQALGGIGLILPILGGRELLAGAIETGGETDLWGVLPQGIALLALLGLMGLVTVIASGRQEVLSELITRHAQRHIRDVASTADLERFEQPAFHNRLQRAALGAGMRPQQLVQGLDLLAQSLAGTVAVVITLVVIEPLLVPVTLAAGVPLWVASLKTGHLMFAMVCRLTPAERERSYLMDLVTRRDSAKEIRALGLARYLGDRWERRTDERLREVRKTANTRVRIALLGRLAGGLVLGVVLVLLVVLVLVDYMPTADAVAAAASVLMLNARLRNAAGGTDLLFEATPFIEDLREFLRLADSPPTGVPAWVPPQFDRLTVEGLTFTYPSGDRPALRDVSLEIGAGEIVAVVGENGSGKTTLAKLLCRLYRPQSGRICLDGMDISDFDADKFRESVTLLFQDFQRYLFSASDNIGVGRWEMLSDLAAVRQAAARAGADEVLAQLPGGYDSLLGPEFVGGTDLSGGQWQRVALGRAFFRDAPFVILDEPTTTLDARAEHALFERIRQLLAGRTVLLISHRFSTVRSADRIYVLADGRVVEQGSHDELMAMGGRYAELFTIQASGYLDLESQLANR